MNRLRERLKYLEAAALRVFRRQDAEREQSAHQLRLLASDAEACELYNKALVATANLDCSHQRFGYCQVCIDAAPAVGTAWKAVQERMVELDHDSNNLVAGK